jgi:hypothetical protein
MVHVRINDPCLVEEQLGVEGAAEDDPCTLNILYQPVFDGEIQIPL